jgi:hypothetical protein
MSSNEDIARKCVEYIRKHKDERGAVAKLNAYLQRKAPEKTKRDAIRKMIDAEISARKRRTLAKEEKGKKEEEARKRRKLAKEEKEKEEEEEGAETYSEETYSEEEYSEGEEGDVVLEGDVYEGDSVFNIDAYNGPGGFDQAAAEAAFMEWRAERNKRKKPLSFMSEAGAMPDIPDEVFAQRERETNAQLAKRERSKIADIDSELSHSDLTTREQRRLEAMRARCVQSLARYSRYSNQ